MAWVRGAIAGTMGLALLEAIVSNSQATANTTGLIGFVSRGMARWLNPNVPLIPDLTGDAQRLPTPAPILGGIIPGAGVAYTPPAAAAPATPMPAAANAGAGTKTV